MRRLTLQRAGAVTVHAEADPGPAFPERTAVIIADEIAVPWLGEVVAPIGTGIEPRVHVIPAGEPTERSVDDAAGVVRSVDDPVVVGVGGGSTLDTAKLAASVAAGPAGVARYLLGAAPLPAGPPVVAVPTTSGTGSEVTRTCVLTDSAGHKVWAWGDELLPALVVLDPRLTASMPAHLTAATGLDAFVHAVEAVTGRRTTPEVQEPAVAAIRLIAEHLPRAVSDGGDLPARAAMQRAAMLAGAAIDAGGTGIAHAIGHAVGTLSHVPHGVAVAAGLRAALEWNLAGSDGAYGSVAAALGCAIGDVPARVDALLDACGFGTIVRRVGPLDVDIDVLAATMVAEENRPMHDNNCRLAGEAERRMLAAATLHRWSAWLDRLEPSA